MYKVELLEKAKMKNIIVYLGTGSGKTFIAVMLIKHMRDELAQKKKVIFLANNVALLEQQAEVISKMTGLKTGSYCGAHGVDDWGRERWEKEEFIRNFQRCKRARQFLTRWDQHAVGERNPTSAICYAD